MKVYIVFQENLIVNVFASEDAAAQECFYNKELHYEEYLVN
jgi:hypothetical protein